MRFRSFSSGCNLPIKKEAVDDTTAPVVPSRLKDYRLAARRKRCRFLPVTDMPRFLFPFLGVS
jgi:hypothetical protein